MLNISDDVFKTAPFMGCIREWAFYCTMLLKFLKGEKIEDILPFLVLMHISTPEF